MVTVVVTVAVTVAAVMAVLTVAVMAVLTVLVTVAVMAVLTVAAMVAVTAVLVVRRRMRWHPDTLLVQDTEALKSLRKSQLQPTSNLIPDKQLLFRAFICPPKATTRLRCVLWKCLIR